MSHDISSNPKQCKVFLLGTSALVCLALATPVMADDFTIASGTTTNDGNTLDGNDTVNVTGALTTTGTDKGIKTTGGTNTVIVSETGSITGAADGIYSSGDDNTVIINGNVTSTSFDGVDLMANNTITVGSSGSITAKDNGIEAEDGNTVNIFGTVVAEYHGIDLGNDTSSTSGGNVVVIHAGAVVRGDTAVKFDNGGNTLTVLGLLDGGIDTAGDGNTITISGSITTGGVDSTGIWNRAANNKTTLTSTGVITVNGDIADGIYNSGNNNITIVHGSIFVNGNGVSSSGDKSSGIFNYGNNNKTTLSGSIKTTGDYSGGIYNYGDSGYHTVSGSITTDGTEAYGIVNSGYSGNTNTNTTSISGTVKSTGTRSAALYNKSGSGNSFTLNEGATIIGDILARDASGTNFDATNSKLIFNLGASTSYAYSVSGKGVGTGAGQWTFSDLDGRTQGITTDGTGCDETIPIVGNIVCNLVTAVGNGNAEAQDELQYSMNSSMIGSLSLGSNTAAPAEVMSFAQTSQSNAWANLYGGSSKRDVSTTQSSFDSSNRGLTIGTPVAVNDILNVDLVFNTSNTKLDIGSTKDQEITAKSYNVGAILRDLAPSSGWGVDAYGFVGRNSYDGKRKVMNNQKATGSESVTASYSGTEVLVGVDAQYSQAIDEALNFIGGVNASLSNEKIGAYSESKYYSWDARTLTQVAGGVTAGLEYHKDAFTSFSTLGLQRSSLEKGKTAGYTNNGTAGSHTDTSGAATYASATVGFNYAADDSMNITGTAGMSRASGGISGSSVSLSANWTF